MPGNQNASLLTHPHDFRSSSSNNSDAPTAVAATATATAAAAAAAAIAAAAAAAAPVLAASVPAPGPTSGPAPGPAPLPASAHPLTQAPVIFKPWSNHTHSALTWSTSSVSSASPSQDPVSPEPPLFLWLPPPQPPKLVLAFPRPSMCSTDKVLHIALAYALNLKAVDNDGTAAARASMFHGREHASPFHAVLNAPPIPLSEYLARIIKYAMCSSACYLTAWALMQRAGRASPHFLVTSWNVHRLLIVTVMIAAKFHDDRHFNNSFYAQIGGLSVAELNSLETAFLSLVRWNVSITPEQFECAETDLLNELVNSCHPTADEIRALLNQAGILHPMQQSTW